MKRIILAAALLFFVGSEAFARDLDKTEYVPPYRIERVATPGGNSIWLNINNPSPKEVAIFFFLDTVQMHLEPDSSNMCRFPLNPGTYRLELVAPLMETVVIELFVLNANERALITVHFQPRELQVPQVRYEYDKPVIYAYAPEEVSFKAQLDFPGALTFTYPVYNNGWNCTTSGDGAIAVDGKTYPYLFWEGISSQPPVAVDFSECFVVETGILIPFLEKTLAEIGLNQKEITDFITYWGPQMVEHERVFLHFDVNGDYARAVPLTVVPKPDAVLRLFMTWKPLGKNLIVWPNAQQFTPVERTGFTIVEWGGTELPMNAGL
jgi:hypothetical protein